MDVGARPVDRPGGPNAGNPVNLLEATMDELPPLIRGKGDPWRTIVEEGVVLVGGVPSEIRATS